MKILAVILFSHVILAVSISTKWSADFSKELVVSCYDSEECHSFFAEEAFVAEEVCSECFSTDLNASFIFGGIGESISTGIEVNLSEFFDFLKNEKFISISYDTPYDLISTQSNLQKRMKYRSLCEVYSQDPILFFEVSDRGDFSTPRYVFCGENVYSLELFDVVIDSLEIDTGTQSLH